MKPHLFIPMVCLTFLFATTCQGQKTSQETNRLPAVAGSFYPEDSGSLSAMLAGFFAHTECKSTPGSSQVVAIVAPHAGYVFSGQVAAWSYAQLDPQIQYNTVFIIGTSHYEHFDGASIYQGDNYITPLGEVKVNKVIADEMISASPYIFFKPSAHLKEHSIEVQLPFLQYHLKHPFKMVPVLLGTSDPAVIKAVADVLEKYRTSGNIFILSTDFSHYPTYAVANNTDSLTAQAFMSHDPKLFRNYVTDSERHPDSGLLTPMCGWPSALVMMRIFGDPEKYDYTPVFHQNSGDTQYGDKTRVVGYYSIMITSKLPPMEDSNSNLNRTEKILLLKIARESIEAYLRTGKALEYDEDVLPARLLNHRWSICHPLQRKSTEGLYRTVFTRRTSIQGGTADGYCRSSAGSKVQACGL